MNVKSLSLLILLTLGIAGFALVSTRSREEAKASGAATGVLFEGLLERVNDVAAIEIQSVDGKLQLERTSGSAGESTDGGWTVASKAGYPARFGDVRELALTIARMEIQETMTRKPERFAKLGLQEPGTDGSSSSRVTLRDAGGAVLADVIVGATRFGGGGEALYVRRAGEDQAWLVSGSLTVNGRATNWIERKVLAFERERMAAVRIVHPDGEELSVHRPDADATNWTVDGIPEGRELTAPAAGTTVGNAVTYLGLDDVAPADTIDFSNAVRSEYTSFDGLVVTLLSTRVGEQWWTRVEARFDPTRVAAPPPEESADAAEELDGEEDTVDLSDDLSGDLAADEDTPDQAADERDVAAEAAELNAVTAGWAYAVSSYKAETFTKHLEDLLKDVVIPEPEVEAPPPQDPSSDVETSDVETDETDGL